MSINDQLNSYLTKTGIKQVTLSKKTGISPDAISRILRNERKISAEEFLEICYALDLDPNEFGKSA